MSYPRLEELKREPWAPDALQALQAWGDEHDLPNMAEDNLAVERFLSEWRLCLQREKLGEKNLRFDLQFFTATPTGPIHCRVRWDDIKP